VKEIVRRTHSIPVALLALVAGWAFAAPAEPPFRDFIVLDRDILTCPVDAIKGIRPVATYLGGKQVYPS
jgi:hypothetical protein